MITAKRKLLLALASALLGSGLAAGCRDDRTPGEKLDRAIDKTGEGIDKAREKVGEGMVKAGEAIKPDDPPIGDPK
jgi:hypothetical protein